MKPNSASPIIKFGTFLFLLMAIFAIGIWTMPYWHKQTINFKLIGDWETKVAAQVDAFQKAEGIEISLGAYTGSQGLVLAHLVAIDDDQTSRAMTFIRSLSPPRPIFWIIDMEGVPTKSFRDMETRM